MPNKKAYIGDGVYAEADNGMIKLTTDRPEPNSFYMTTHTIWLEPEVLAALNAVAKDLFTPPEP